MGPFSKSKKALPFPIPPTVPKKKWLFVYLTPLSNMRHCFLDSQHWPSLNLLKLHSIDLSGCDSAISSGTSVYRSKLSCSDSRFLYFSNSLLVWSNYLCRLRIISWRVSSALSKRCLFFIFFARIANFIVDIVSALSYLLREQVVMIDVR
jgi:hypothetical protein